MNTRLCTAALLCLGLAHLPNAHADRLWQWHYAGQEIRASGTVTTEDEPDASGWYTIKQIRGKRNGSKIVALVPKGQAVPGNEPYGVDNQLRVRVGKQGQLTTSGFGFVTAAGVSANPFCKEPDQADTCYEFSSHEGKTGVTTAEKQIRFAADKKR